jgi:multiple sugar transport system permease protein
VVMNAPLLIITATMIVVPVVGTVITSLYRDVAFLPESLSFPDNYIRLFSDALFWQSVRFTLLFTIASVAIETCLGLFLALLLNEAIPGRGFLRVMLLLPWAIPNAVSARIWELIYNYQFGVLNYLIVALGVSQTPINWLGTQGGATAAVLAADIWKMTPFVTIILLAGLSSIPEVLYRQATIDGADVMRRFFYITLRLLKPALVVAVLFRTIDSIRVFDLLYVLTGGGPGGSTTSLSLEAYNYYISGDLGYGSTLSVIVFLLAFALAVLYIRFGRFSEAIT